jgi:hypothetical protein
MTQEQYAQAKAKLSPDELRAYNEYIDAGKPSLSPVTEKQFYELYLNGKPTTEIQRINPSMPLGIIVRAKIDNRWDERREFHIAQLLEGVKERVQHTQLEAINFACDLLSVVHKQQGEKLKRYLQTGDDADLSSIANGMGLKSYKEVLEILLKLTGQDKDKGDKKVEITHKIDDSPRAAGLSPLQAAKILEVIDDAEIVGS